MAEGVRIGYTRLFEVRVLHHYWLDDGATVFDEIADEAVQDAAAARPTTCAGCWRSSRARRPRRRIAGLRGVFRHDRARVPGRRARTTPSCRSTRASSSSSPRRPADYADYTALTLRPQPIVDVTDPPIRTDPSLQGQRPVLSNLTGALADTGRDQAPVPVAGVPDAVAGDGVEALVTSGRQLRQLTGDPPNAPFHVLGPTADATRCTSTRATSPRSPAGRLAGAPARGIELAADTPRDVAAVIRLAPGAPTTTPSASSTPTGRTRTRYPVFEVHLRNRWTTWRYRNKRDGSVTSTEADPLPLTHFGNAGTKQKPSTAAIGVERDSRDPPKITRLVSDIYV